MAVGDSNTLIAPYRCPQAAEAVANSKSLDELYTVPGVCVSLYGSVADRKSSCSFNVAT